MLQKTVFYEVYFMSILKLNKTTFNCFVDMPAIFQWDVLQMSWFFNNFMVLYVILNNIVIVASLDLEQFYHVITWTISPNILREWI